MHFFNYNRVKIFHLLECHVLFLKEELNQSLLSYDWYAIRTTNGIKRTAIVFYRDKWNKKRSIRNQDYYGNRMMLQSFLYISIPLFIDIFIRRCSFSFCLYCFNDTHTSVVHMWIDIISRYPCIKYLINKHVSGSILNYLILVSTFSVFTFIRRGYTKISCKGIIELFDSTSSLNINPN